MHLLPRALVRHPSGRLLNLLTPDPMDWKDEDLAIGLARTYRWGGHTISEHPLSVAQHAITVLAFRMRPSPHPLSADQELREPLHDADEALIGGFDAISPLKPIIGPSYASVVEALQKAVSLVTNHLRGIEAIIGYTSAERLAAASEAVHVAGWSLVEVQDLLNIGLTPLLIDPLVERYDFRP